MGKSCSKCWPKDAVIDEVVSCGTGDIGRVVELCDADERGLMYQTLTHQRYKIVEGRHVQATVVGEVGEDSTQQLPPGCPRIQVPEHCTCVLTQLKRRMVLRMSDKRSFTLKFDRKCAGSLMARCNTESMSAGLGVDVQKEIRKETCGGKGQLEMELLVPTVEIEFAKGATLADQRPSAQKQGTALPFYVHRIVLGVQIIASIELEQGNQHERRQTQGSGKMQGADLSMENGFEAGMKVAVGSDLARKAGPVAQAVTFLSRIQLDTANIAGVPLDKIAEDMESKAEVAATKEPWNWEVLFVGVARVMRSADEETKEWHRVCSKLLAVLEEAPEPELDATVPERIRNTVQAARKAIRESAKSMLVVGDTGSGKSSFCGLLNGSLGFDPQLKRWKSTFEIGCGADSQTNKTELQVCAWLGNTDSRENMQLVVLDSPGLGDTRGEAMDQIHMDEVAQIVIGIEKFHVIALILNNNTRISRPLRATLQYLQDVFGAAMWEHVIVVVNRWGHDSRAVDRREDGKDMSAQEFSDNFRRVLMKPVPQRASIDRTDQGDDTHMGLGLTEDETKAIRFFFVDTQYDRDENFESESMRSELQQMRLHIATMGLWKADVHRPCSPALQGLITAVRNRSDTASLQAALHDAESIRPQPADISQEKLEAVRQEIERRAEVDKCRTLIAMAKSAIADARAAFQELRSRRIDPQDAAYVFLRAMRVATSVLDDIDMEGLRQELEHLPGGLGAQIKVLSNNRRQVERALREGVSPDPCEDEAFAETLALLTEFGEAAKKREEFLRAMFKEAGIATAAGTVLQNACAWVESQGVNTRAEVLRRCKDFAGSVGLREFEAQRLERMLELGQNLHMNSTTAMQAAEWAKEARLCDFEELLEPLADLQQRLEQRQDVADEAEQQRQRDAAEQESRALEARRLEMEAEQRKTAEEAERRRLEVEAELQKIAADAERRRLEMEAEQQKIAAEVVVEAERRRVEIEEAQQKIAAEAERRRLAEEAQQQKIAAELAAEAERRRLELEALQQRTEADGQRLEKELALLRFNAEAEAERKRGEAVQRSQAEHWQLQQQEIMADERRRKEEAEAAQQLQKQQAEREAERRLQEVEVEKQRIAADAKRVRWELEAQLERQRMEASADNRRLELERLALQKMELQLALQQAEAALQPQKAEAEKDARDKEAAQQHAENCRHYAEAEERRIDREATQLREAEQLEVEKQRLAGAAEQRRLELERVSLAKMDLQRRAAEEESEQEAGRCRSRLVEREQQLLEAQHTHRQLGEFRASSPPIQPVPFAPVAVGTYYMWNNTFYQSMEDVKDAYSQAPPTYVFHNR